MRLPVFFALSLLCLSSLRASSVKASAFGYQPDDATQAFQSAVGGGYDTVIVDLQPTPWVVQPNTFLDLDGLTLIFEPGVELVAKPGGFTGSGDCLLRFVRCQNLVVWGYGATLKMQKAEYTTGEWRHALSINYCTNIQVYGLTLRDSGGDGIYVGAEDFWGPGLYSKSVYLRDCRCINNRRQGISVVSAEGLWVFNCWFEDTNGTLPESGVNIEPDRPEYKAKSILFRNCRFTNNNGNGIELSLQHLNGSSDTVGIVFEYCYVSHNHHPDNPYAPAEIAVLGAQTNAAEGLVSFRNCLVEDSPWSALYVRKPADAYYAEFLRCVFQNISQDSAFFYNQPIRVEVPSYSDSVGRYGGLIMHECLIKYNTDTDWFRAYGWFNSPGLGTVQGDVFVVNPHAPDADYGTDPDVSMTVMGTTSLPKVTMVAGATDPVGYEPPAYKPMEVLISHTIEHNAPIAAKYAVAGATTQGLDYSLLPGFFVLTGFNESFPIEPVGDNITEGTENLEIVLIPTEDYQLIPGFDTAHCQIMEPVSRVHTPAGAPLQLFPNPAADYVEWPFDEPGDEAIVRSINGDFAGRISLNNRRLYVGGLPPGIYLIQIGARVGKLVRM